VAVSAQKDGVLPVSQQSIFVLLNLAYHDYEGVALREDEKARLVEDLGSKSFLMLRNHGLLTCGRSVPEAFQLMYIFQSTCAIQIRAQSGGGELIPIQPAIIATAAEQARLVSNGMGPEKLLWPGLLRRLDRLDPSYRE
jgi:ribulose-5-phosphate 4-epimerase/fuculose-1-phosphate aldolase